MRKLTVPLLCLAYLQLTLSAKQDKPQLSKLEDFSTKSEEKSTKPLDSYLPRKVDWPGKQLSPPPPPKKLGAPPPPEKPSADEFPVRLSVDEHPLRKDSEPLKRNIVSEFDLDADNSLSYYYGSYWPYYSYYYRYWPYYYYGLGYRYRYVPYFNKYWSKWRSYYSYPYNSYYDNYYYDDDYDWYRRR
ncbi:hypothetical protein LSTR_LSTR012179 [Laodelphax striatellus]|uniref:Uncharacterized protein n=1 Tax=Laodelphax striatellus TaxID=195883 RepID=A0A482WYM3_LAOST|nr:hypothetical protein LSTR_LSTR012179 [Laodelphax striatellus]